MQMVQAVCFVYVHAVNATSKVFWNPNYCCRYISLSMVIIVMLLVPIASWVHFGLNFDLVWHDADNKIKTWLFIYPALGVMNIVLWKPLCPLFE